MKGRQFITSYRQLLKPGVKSFALIGFFHLTPTVNSSIASWSNK